MKNLQRRDDVGIINGYASIPALQRILNSEASEVWSLLHAHAIEPRRIARDRRWPLSQVISALYEGGEA